MRLRRRPPARPPERVRVVRRDGSEVPVEVVYVGWRRGSHVWRAALESVAMAPGDALAIGTLPPHTSVEVMMAAK